MARDERNGREHEEGEGSGDRDAHQPPTVCRRLGPRNRSNPTPLPLKLLRPRGRQVLPDYVLVSAWRPFNTLGAMPGVGFDLVALIVLLPAGRRA